jgi:hypothetical protein
VAQKTVYFDVTNAANAVVAGSVGVTNQSGTAQAGTITLPANDVGGNYTVTAYFGSATTPLPAPASSYNATDPDYAPAAPASSSLDVVDATQTSLLVAPSPSVNGQAVTLDATVAPANSDGSVTFSEGTKVVCNAVPLASGTASCPVAGLGAGGYSFSASYSGLSGSYLPSGPAPASTTVGAAATTTTLTAPASAPFGSKVALSAQVNVTSPGSGTPTGTVTFYDGTAVLGTGALAVGSGGADVASLSVSGLQAGTQPLSAAYGGSTGFTASTSASAPVKVGVTFTKTISTNYSGPVTVASGQTVLITGKVAGPVTVLAGGGLEIDNGSVSGPVTTAGAMGSRCAAPLSLGRSLCSTAPGTCSSGAAPAPGVPVRRSPGR